jgi:hypothetical protein
MKKVYIIDIQSADTTTSTDQFIQNQSKITAKVKKELRKKVKDAGLQDEFAFVSSRVPNISRAIEIYASPEVIKKIEMIDGVKGIKEHPTLNRNR